MALLSSNLWHLLIKMNSSALKGPFGLYGISGLRGIFIQFEKLTVSIILRFLEGSDFFVEEDFRCVKAKRIAFQKEL